MEGQGPQDSSPTLPTVETEDRNFPNSMTKSDEKNQEDVPMTDLNAEGMSDPTHKKGKHTLLEELLHNNSNSSLSSDDEVEDGGDRKKRKKKGFKDGSRQKLSGEKEECNKQPENAMDNSIEVENAEVTNPEEKKGFLDKIKEKLPGHHKKTERGASFPCTDEDSPRGETKEKKGIMDKIIEKLPGHYKNEDEPKEKEN